MATEDKFAFPEDEILFSYLVANQLCFPADRVGLLRLQGSEPVTRALRYVLGVDLKRATGVGDVLQSQIGPKISEQLCSTFPRLSEALETSRSLIAQDTPAKDSMPREMSLEPLIEELRDKRVEMGNRERQLEAWADAAVLFLETVEALETNPDFDEVRRDTAGSLRKQFMRTFGRLGFVLLLPDRGDLFDESQHMVDSVDENEKDLAPSSVVRCVQWGYRLPNGQVLKAKVIITEDRRN
jgi:hypothetical protein